MMDEMMKGVAGSMPMTGTGGPKRRSIPQQDGNGESETDFAVDYLPPSLPSDLVKESHHVPAVVRLARRQLGGGLNRRSL